jgi:hypothetical protein
LAKFLELSGRKFLGRYSLCYTNWSIQEGTECNAENDGFEVRNDQSLKSFMSAPRNNESSKSLNKISLEKADM